MLGAMDIFKYLPAGAKKSSANCKKCNCPTCMMFALKLAKKQVQIESCPHAPEELIAKINEANKIQQKEVEIDGKIFGGEKVMFRHEKTFINPTGLFVELDLNEPDVKQKFERIKKYEIESIGQKFKIDGIYLKGNCSNYNELEIEIKQNEFAVLNDEILKKFQEINEGAKGKGEIPQLVNDLTFIRKKAILERDENFSDPICVKLSEKNPEKLCVIASALICKYASIIIFENFDEAVISTLITLRQNIFTDPEKPLQVDSKVYEFNNPDENALVFLTTNFALTYFAVANELSSLRRGSYLVVTPSEGMSVLTAWSAEKITAKIAKKIIDANEVLEKVKTKKIIIPGLLADLKEDLEDALRDKNWEIVIGSAEAYKIPELIKQCDW